MEAVSIAQARQNLPALVHEVERQGSLQLTRRGRPVAVMLSLTEYDRLLRAQDGKPSLWEAIARFRARRDPEVEFSEADFAGLREASQRPFDWPE